MSDNNVFLLSVFSFDFRQPAQSNQARKTRFFRRLYGYTQRVKRRSKNGQVVEYSYHYPGLLDQLPHIKLGKSVFGVRPGSEYSILELLDKFQEITYHQFIGWIRIDEWPEIDYRSYLLVSQLIKKLGFLSILVIVAQHNHGISKSSLVEFGFENEYIDTATAFLEERKLLENDDGLFIPTRKGSLVAEPFLRDLSTSK